MTNETSNYAGSLSTQSEVEAQALTPLPAYVRTRILEPGERVHHTQQVYHGVLLDFTEDNRLIGVEILS